MPHSPLDLCRKLAAIAQSGLTYAENAFDVVRYSTVQELTASLLSQLGGVERGPLLAQWQQEAGYATPKVDVRAVVWRDERVLLVHEKADGLWSLPGGYADVNEPPSQCVEREVREEAGFLVRATKLLALYDAQKHGHPASLHHYYKLFFACELLPGKVPASANETLGAEFFALNQLPPLSTNRVTAAQLQRMGEHRLHPEWPSDFD